MVLPSRDLARHGPVSLPFSSSSDDYLDVKKFFFYYENVVMKTKKDEENSEELLPFLEWELSEFYYSRFGKDKALIPATTDYQAAKISFFENFMPRQDPEVAIRSTTDLRLGDDDLLALIENADQLNASANFNDSAKIGLLRKAIQGHQKLVQFIMFRGPHTYAELVEVIKMFDKSISYRVVSGALPAPSGGFVDVGSESSWEPSCCMARMDRSTMEPTVPHYTTFWNGIQDPDFGQKPDQGSTP